MAENKVGFLQAVWRFFSFWKLRKTLGLIRAADRQFTGSAAGIRDAFDIHQDSMVNQYQELHDAISEVEMTIEQDRQRLEELNGREKDILGMRDGALAKFEESESTGDEQVLLKHQEAFERFDAEILDIETQQEGLRARIQETESTMDGYLRQLTKLQAEIKQLPRQKAQAIADFVSSNKIVELNARLNGLKTSIERGPIDAVLEQNKKLTAKARISQKLAGTEVEQQDDEYRVAGKSSTARERMQQMLAARKVERDAKTGAKPDGEKETRPEI